MSQNVTKVLNKQGRGRAFPLSIKDTPETKRLLGAIREGDGEEAVMWSDGEQRVGRVRFTQA